MALKLKSAHLNPYEQAYDQLSVTPYFNQTDWETSMNRSEQDLSSYITLVSQYNKLGDIAKYEDEYLWSQMNTDERTLLMYNELYGNKTDEKEWDITVSQDAEGNDITEKFKGTEYQYYDKLLKNSASLKNEQNLLYERQITKDNKNFFELLGGSMLATATEFTAGVNSIFEDTLNFMDAGVDFIWEMTDVREGISKNWEDATQRFRDKMEDEYFFPGMKEYVKPSYEALLEWERDNTYYMTIDGQRTTAGKLLGDNFYSIGQMAGSILSNYIVPGSGQIVFYGSMFENRLQDKFRNDKFNSISTELIVGEAAIETGAEYLVEFALGKLFGTTSTDELRGVSGGRTLRDIVSAMPRKGSAVARYVSEALQEGTEELLQELSTWGVANLTSLIQDEFRTDITIEQLTDAFIGGAFSSLIIGGFNSTYNYFYNEGRSKAVSIFDPNYVSLNEDVLITGKETKEQKRYRKARDKFVQTKELVEEFSKYEVKPHKLGLGAITEAYDKLVGNVDVTSETGVKFLKQLNKQMYASYKLMMDIYGEFGIDRAKKAESLLSELNKYADTKQGREYVDESVKAVQTLSEQIDKLLVDKDEFEREKIKDATKKAVEKADKTDTKKRGRPKGSKNKPKETEVKLTKEDETEVKAIFDKVSKSLRFDDGTTEELKTATELANLYSHELEIWNNHEIIEVDGKIFAPIKAAENLSAEELMRAGAENTIVNEFNEALPIEVKNKLTKFYNEFAKVDDSVDAIWHTLYDQKFYNYVVNRADEDTFNILKTLDNLSIIKIKGNTEIHMYREYNLAVRRIRKTMGPILALYFCNNPDASLENVTVFDEAQLRFINEHRYNSLMANVIIYKEMFGNKSKSNPNYDNYYNVIINRINNLPFNDDAKKQLKDKLNSYDHNERKEVFDTLNFYTDTYYFSKYDNYYKIDGFDASSAKINSFLDFIKIKYVDLINGEIPLERSDIREGVASFCHNYINKDVNDDYLVFQYYRKQFENFTNNTYSLERTIVQDELGVKFSVKLIELKHYTSELDVNKFKFKRGVILDKLSYVNPSNIVTNINEYLTDILKIDDFELRYTNIDDIVSNPEKYLNDSFINEIKSNENVINKHVVAKYIRKILLKSGHNNLSIVPDRRGRYKPVIFEYSDKFFTPNVYKYYNNGTILLDNLKSSRKKYKISEFINTDKLIGELNNINLTFIKSKNKFYEGAIGAYEEHDNSIKIFLNEVINDADLLNAIIHEYQHAVQYFNNLHSGKDTLRLSDELLDDIKLHVPGLFKNVSNDEEIRKRASYYVYFNLTGETISRGEYNMIYNDPIIWYVKNDVPYTYMPWGKVYATDVFKGIYKTYNKKFTELAEGEKRKLTPEEVKENYEEASIYVNGINKALDLIKQNKANGVKTYKKDLKQFKLPNDVVNDLIKGTYTKGADTRWTYYRRIVNTHDRGTSKQRHKKYFEEGRATDKGRQIFAKNAKGTNLEYWLEKYPNKIPEVDAAVQEFVISATDFKKLDRKLVNQIKNATLTWIGVENFIRDADDINQYTFNELKKAFFKNTPFKSFDEVKSFVNIVEKGSALSAALQSIGMSDQIYKEIKTDLSKFDEFLTKLSNAKAVKKIYDKNLVTFNTFYYKEGNKTTKIETNMDEASADIVLGLLKYFDRTIDSLSYIANNAKYALRRAAITESAFTYKQKRDAAGNKTLSFDTNVKGKKDNESGHALYELIEDERQRLDENTDAENRDALMRAAYEHIASLMKDGKMSVDELKVLAQTYKKNIRSFSDDEVAYRLAVINTLDNTGITFDEALNVEELVTNIVDPEVTIDVGNRTNSYKKLSNNIRAMSNDISPNLYNNLPDEYKKYFDPNNNYKINRSAVKGLNASELDEINRDILKLKKRIKAGEFLSKRAAKSAKQVNDDYKKLSERLAEEKRKNKVLTEKLKKSKGEKISDARPGKVIKTYEVKISTDVNLTSTKPMPDKLRRILEVSFSKERESKKQFRFIENEKYFQVSMEEFFRQNAENLQNLTEQDVVEIFDFIENAHIVDRVHVPYDAMTLFLLGYFIEQSEIIHRFNLDPEILKRIHIYIDDLVSNSAAKVLGTWKGVMTLVDPTRTIVNEMLRIYDLDLEGEPEVDELVKALKYLNTSDKATVNYKPNGSDLEAFKYTVDHLNQIMQNLERKILEKYRKSGRDKSKDLEIFGKKFKRQNIVEVREILSKERLTVDDVKTIKTLLGNDIFNDMVSKKEITLTKSGAINRTKKSLQIFENALEKYEFAKIPSTRDLQNQILKFQKAMMLSAPATIVRNKLSNLIIGGYTWKDAEGNYEHIGGLNDFADLLGRLAPPKIVGKTSVSQYNFVKVKVSKNTMEFIQKWVRETGLLDLVSDGLTKYDARETKVRSNLENQLMSMIVKSTANRVLGTNTYDNDVLNNITNFIFKLQSDNTAIQNTALRLFGKMLEADKVDLTYGLNEKVMTYLANAYSEAAYEYMHKGNVLNDLMNNLKRKHPNTYFVLNLAQPFISSSWNWFVDTLQMNPVALVVNIRRLMTLENYVNKLDERRQKGDMSVPDSRFAEMLIRRNIGKGIIGTVLMLVGGLLAAFGKIVVDDEDEKLKLKVGNTYIDFSNVYGSSAILVGAQFGSGGGDFWTLLESAFNQQFEDSVLTTFMNAFRYDSTPWEYLTSLPTTIVSGFIPNVWKQAVKLTQNHTIDYDAGMLGNLQYLAVQTIPFIEYAMPKGIDPYTGEWEERYSVPAVHQLATLIGSPISFKTYAKSDVELAFDEVGLNKKMLNGNYKDIGQVNTTYLNEFYGKRNKIRVSEFINNKVKYSVEDEEGKRQDLLYKQMTYEQRKSVLNRITTQNANYAKIYAWTQMGHKYYCSASERTELMKIGITKNIYIGNKGFVK